jgi:putative ABC transport system permease protein
MILDSDNWQEIFEALRKNKMRSLLTAFGVFWGIFMLILMLGAGNGLRNGVIRDFEGSATNSFFMWAQQTSKPYKGMQANRSFQFNLADAEALRTNMKGAEIIAPMIQLGGYQNENNVIRGLRTAAFSVYGIEPDLSKIQQFRLQEGRFLNHADLTECRKVAVIGGKVLEKLFMPGENPIGAYIKINGINFMVTGLLNGAGSGHQAREQDESIYIPFTAFSRAFNTGNRIGWLSVKTRSDVPAEEAEEQAMNILKKRHLIAPDDNRAIGHWNMQKEFDKLNGLFTGIEWLVWIVGLGTLLAGIIGVSNIMLIVVKERSREIGVRRAIGATPFSIVSQLILESVVLTAAAGYGGLLAGIGLLELVNTFVPSGEDMLFSNPGVELHIAVRALLLMMAGGALAGLIPAQRALEISPVEALRTE